MHLRSQRQLMPILSRTESNRGAAANALDPLESSNAAIAHLTATMDGTGLHEPQSVTAARIKHSWLLWFLRTSFSKGRRPQLLESWAHLRSGPPERGIQQPEPRYLHGLHQRACSGGRCGPSNEYPNAHDYDELLTIYSHPNSFSTFTIRGNGAGAFKAAGNTPREWGQASPSMASVERTFFSVLMVQD